MGLEVEIRPVCMARISWCHGDGEIFGDDRSQEAGIDGQEMKRDLGSRTASQRGELLS